MGTSRIIHIALEIWGSVFCALAAICMFHGKIDKKRKHDLVFWLLVCSGVMSLFDAAAWFFRGDESMLGYYMVRISNFSVFALFFVNGYLISDFLLYVLNDERMEYRKRPVWYKLYNIGCLIGVSMYVINLFVPWLYDFDSTNHYYRLPLFPVVSVFGILIISVYLVIMFKHIKEIPDADTVPCLSFGVLPIMAFIVTIFYYGVSLTYFAMIAAALISFSSYMIERANLNDRRSFELKERETALMMSQVSPHFIFNSLAAIRGLVLENPETAYDTIGEFASYLRTNLNVKRLDENVRLEDELENAMIYVNLEKLRLGEKLQIMTDVEDENVLIPAMSIQPIVENAIKHGIKPKGEGDIIITETTEDDHYVIRIIDDGVGFDVENAGKDGKVHIGMNSVKERIKYMINGDVEYKSTPGEGTEVSIYIPIKKKNLP